MSTQEAQELLEHIVENIKRLNALLEACSYHELRLAGLQTRYSFAGAGSPYAGVGLTAIIPPNKEHMRHVFLPPPAEVREYGRERLRKLGMPEPMIWERWPAQPHEREEQETRLRSYVERKEKSRPKAADPFQDYLQTEARRAAKATRRSESDLLSDKDFCAKAKELWDLIESI